jgi:membrane protease YdiL (CAAX protease family)
MTESAVEGTAPGAWGRGGWLWPAVVMGALTALVPSIIYVGFARGLSSGVFGLQKYLSEFIGAGAALFVSLLVLRHYDKKEGLGLDQCGLFTLRPYGRTAWVLAAGVLAEAALLGGYLWVALKYYRDYEGGSNTIPALWLGNDKWFFVAASTFLYACCEEIFLRGMVFTYIRKHAGFLKALIVSSLIFSLLHGGRLWVGLTAIFFSGIILALAYEKTRSLAVPTLLHGLHNTVLRIILVTGLLD